MLLNQDQWSYLKQLNDDIWVFYSGYGMPVLLFFMIYKLLYPVFWQDIKYMVDFPQTIQDKILRPFIIYGPIYYLFDVIIKILSGRAFQDACQASFFMHHLCCVIFLPFAVISRYVPWFFLVIALGHAILLWYKSKILEYLYLCSLLTYHYGVMQAPFNRVWQFRWINWGTWILHLTIISLFLNGCSN